MPQDWVCVGQFGAPHGVKGEVRLAAFTADADTLKGLTPLCLGPDGKVLDVRFTRAAKSGFFVKVVGYEDRESVARLSSKKLYVPRAALPEDDDADSYYLSDLLGLQVIDSSGQSRGRVKAVPNYGAGTLLELALDEAVEGLGKTVLVPFEKRYVPRVSVQDSVVEVDMVAWVSGQFLGDKQAGRS